MDKYRKVYLVDEDRTARLHLSQSLISADFEVRSLDERDFADLAPSLPPGCAVVEIFHENVSNFGPLEIAVSRDNTLPTIAMCADCNIQIAVTAIKLGALDVYEKRTPASQLITIVEKVVFELPSTIERLAAKEQIIDLILSLTVRQFQILKLISEGNLTKTVAHQLNLSPRTVEMHREAITQRLNCKRMVDAIIMLQSVSDETEIIDRCSEDVRDIEKTKRLH